MSAHTAARNGPTTTADRYSVKATGGSSRAREQVFCLSATLQHMLNSVRARGGRKMLLKAKTGLDNPDVLQLTSGAQMGLGIISALQDVVADEGEVCAYNASNEDTNKIKHAVYMRYSAGTIPTATGLKIHVPKLYVRKHEGRSCAPMRNHKHRNIRNTNCFAAAQKPLCRF